MYAGSGLRFLSVAFLKVLYMSLRAALVLGVL